MNKRQELIQTITNLFSRTLDLQAMKNHNYSNNDYKISFERFYQKVKELGLRFGDTHYTNGIGNNVNKPIYLRTTDEDGFICDKYICTFYYCLGIFGGVYASIKDENTTLISLGNAR